MSTPTPSVPKELDRFPQEAKQAYQRFVEDGDEADLRILLKAALLDFMPNRQKAAGTKSLEGSQKLIEDLGLDSLAVAEMVFFFEDIFQVSIPSNEILNLQTVADLEGYVSRKLGEKKSGA